MSDAPFRIGFDEARDPYAARVALRAATNPVPTDQIADDAITTAKIADGAVTAIKLADTYATAADFPAGAWTAWSPTVTASGGTITTSTVNFARYTKMGKTIVVCFNITIVNKGTGSGYLIVTLPVTASASGGGATGGHETTTATAVSGQIGNGATATAIARYDGVTVITNGLNVACTSIYEGT